MENLFDILDNKETCELCGFRDYKHRDVEHLNQRDDDDRSRNPIVDVNWSGLWLCKTCVELRDERFKLRAHELRKEAAFYESLIGRLQTKEEADAWWADQNKIDPDRYPTAAQLEERFRRAELARASA